jgi:hypothetical protein
MLLSNTFVAKNISKKVLSRGHLFAYVCTRFPRNVDRRAHAESVHPHLTTLSHFLHRRGMGLTMDVRHFNQRSLRKVLQHAKQTGLPIYVILDDSVCEKTKPSCHGQNRRFNKPLSLLTRKSGSVWEYPVVHASELLESLPVLKIWLIC